MDVKLVAQVVGDATVVSVSGEIDVFTAPQLREVLMAAIEGGSRRMIVDLEGVEFLDSTGLAVLVAGLKRVREAGGDLHVVCTRDHILRVLELTGLDKVLAVHASLDSVTPPNGAAS